MYDLTASQTPREKQKISVLTKGVVYQLTCQECSVNAKNSCYIGETGRTLKERLREHFGQLRDRTRLTEVGKHDINEHGEFKKERWKIAILHVERDDFRRKSYESAYIKAMKPSINNQAGIRFEFSELILPSKSQPLSIALEK